MKTLFNFPIPPENEVALCEVDGRVHFTNFQFASLNVFTNAVDGYPNVHITRGNLLPARSAEDTKELFAPVDIPFTKHLAQVFYEQGLIAALNVAANNRRFPFSKVAVGVLKVVTVADRIQNLWGKRKIEPILLISELVQTRNWQNGIIRCLAWHPDRTKVAVGTSDDAVRIFSKGVDFVPILRCKQQKNITAIAWRPLCDLEVAVAGETHIVVWVIDPYSTVLRPSVSNAIILSRSNHSPIVSISWSKTGDILASAAANDPTILMWNVEMDRTSLLKRPGGRGNTIVRWSSKGDKMFSATSSLVFRVWETHWWQPEKWNTLTGRVQTACWSPCGKILLFATTEEPTIYGLHFSQGDLVFTKDSETSSNVAIPLFDLTRVEVSGRAIGGLVRTMDWDPTGNHLAVLFRDTDYVAVFTVTFRPVIDINPSCLISGAPEETPCVLQFQRDFDQGACLSIGWSSGRLQYFPIVYVDLDNSAGLRKKAF